MAYRWLSSKVLLVTGKGGVGKTTVTAALARAAAARDKQVLVCEMDDNVDGPSPLARLFGREAFPPDPVDLGPGLSGVTLTPWMGHQAFIREAIPTRMLAKLALSSTPLRRLLHAVPSCRELGILFHLLRIAEAAAPHHLIVVDMPATGHTVGLVEMPTLLMDLIPFGPLAEALKRGRAAFLNNPQTQALVVTLPEALPVTEALELSDQLHRAEVKVGGMVLNRVYDLDLDDSTLAKCKVWLADNGYPAAEAIETIERARVQEARLRAELQPDEAAAPFLRVPDASPELLAATIEQALESAT